jgi:hypothetical protein
MDRGDSGGLLDLGGVDAADAEDLIVDHIPASS